MELTYLKKQPTPGKDLQQKIAVSKSALLHFYLHFLFDNNCMYLEIK